MDYATHYPKAIPLWGMQVAGVVRALLQMFSLVGIPKEILTDKGVSFTSNLMRQLCRMLQIKQLFTTIYLPQTHGCEPNPERITMEGLWCVPSQMGLLPGLSFVCHPGGPPVFNGTGPI